MTGKGILDAQRDMGRDVQDSVTGLIQAANGGDADALRRLFARVYDELKRLARIQLAKAGGQTLNTTGLVHEAYLKLAQPGERGLQDSEHFFSLAARAMRQIVIDRARAQVTAKRGGAQREVVDFDAAFDVAGGDLGPEALLRLNEALDRFASDEPRLAQLVELRFFAGLELEQIAVLQQVSERTLNRDWRRAKVRLYLALGS
ncbi:MAG: ECF-type sigma factor [Rudaea sp.]|uniref:ECF-type sigma factor n=1 Tax=Rudaea sp. TaxID=2136325 RepID=UPI0039E3552C